MSDFTKATVKALANKGVKVIGRTFVQGADGSFANGETAYKVDDNGTGRVWTFTQVLAAARV